MQVQVDAQTVLPSPLERLQNVLPSDFFQERLVGVLLDRPEGDGETDPVETCTGDLGKVLFGLWGANGVSQKSKRDKEMVETYDKGVIVLLELVEATIRGVLGHGLRKRPFIVSGWCGIDVGFEQSRDDERFRHEPSSEINTEKGTIRNKAKDYKGQFAYPRIGLFWKSHSWLSGGVQD